MRKETSPKKRTHYESWRARSFEALATRFMEFCSSYHDLFNVARRNVSGKARCYVAGLLHKAPAKNMERMEDYVEDFDYQSQQQFLSDSPWDHRKLMDRVGRDVSEVIGGANSSLVLDETAFAKQGRKSVGVARQWNGRLGKVDNCQVGVFAALTNGQRSGLVDFRLYLPAEWAEDAQRCGAAKIPADQIRFRKKSELAIEMVDSALANGLDFGWVLADGGYGKEPDFLSALDNRGLRFIVDVHRDQGVYMKDPRPYLPRRKNGLGRKYTRYRAREKSVELEALFDSISSKAWRNYTLRDTTRGAIKVTACSRRVWLWDGRTKNAREWTAVCVKFAATGETKWFVSNAPASTSLHVLLQRHSDRYWVERTFQDAKSSVGMADYQARGWVAWHHHMAMVALALLFMLRERVVHNREIEMLSCNDLIELLTVYLPRKDVRPEEVIRNIERRHRKRLAAIAARSRAPNTASPLISVF